MLNSNQGRQRRRRQRFPLRRTKINLSNNENENPTTVSDELFAECERTKEKILGSATDQSSLWIYRQEYLDQYVQLVLYDLDFSLEKKTENDLWMLVFKNDINQKQEQLKYFQQNPVKRAETQTSLQLLYEYARGFYLKLLQDVIHRYQFETSICKLSFQYLKKRPVERQCKEASMIYLIQHILVRVGDLNRYSNQIELSKIFYQYAIETIPCLGQAYNQIAILHEMKNPTSLLNPGQNQLITAYFYVRSIAIKVMFPSAVANLEKFFQRFKDIPLTRYQNEEFNENDFLSLFLKIISMINLDRDSSEIEPLVNKFRSFLMKYFNMNHFIYMITIIMFTCHRSLGYLSRASMTNKPSEQQFDEILQLFLILIEQCLETSQLPLSMMTIDEQELLPILYLSFTYLANIQKTKLELFNHSAFKQKTNMWNSLAKLLRSFGVSARTSKDGNESILLKFVDYPLAEERTLECFTPLNDLLKGYNFKKYQSRENQISEKDERQLRKFRFVNTIKSLCQKIDDLSKKRIFDYLLVYVKDDLIYFEPSTVSAREIPSSNFGAPGDHRRNVQKANSDDSQPVNPSGINAKTTRATRNVALRQFLGSNVTADSWPNLKETENLFQQKTIGDETRLNSVWTQPNEFSDQFNQSVLPSSLMFTADSSEAIKK